MYVLYDYRELKVDVIFSWEWKINNDLHKLAGDCGTRVDAYLPTSRGPRPSRPLASPPRVGALPPHHLLLHAVFVYVPRAIHSLYSITLYTKHYLI